MTNNINPKSQKILKQLERRYDALYLIHQLYRTNKGACICEHLKQMSPTPPRVHFEVSTLAENISLSSLLCCPIMKSEHLYSLLKIKCANKRRSLHRSLKHCEQSGLVQSQMVSSGRSGLHKIWYLTRKGYTAAMKFYLPDNPIPMKMPVGSMNNLEHAFVLADLFCELMIADSLEATFDNLQKIYWYPPHKLMRKYDTGYNSRRYDKRIYPDAIIENKQDTLRIYLEVDRDTKSLGQESDKLKIYLDYFIDTDEGYRNSGYRDPPEHVSILYSVPTPQRGEAILKAYRKLLEKPEWAISNKSRFPIIQCFTYEKTVPVIRKLLEEFK